MKLQSLPTFLVRRKNWLLMAALALSLTAALLLRPSSPQAQRVTLPMTSAESSVSPLEAFRISRDSAYQRDMAALEKLLAHHPRQPKHIYCTYTAMMRLRKLLSIKTDVEAIR